jgi:unsaturated chondroitin disaccharide hydrolase
MYNWVTSFITGLAPLFYRVRKDGRYISWAEKYMDAYHTKIFRYPLETMHDIGFLYSPYSAALYRLTGDSEHRTVALKAADELLKRFDIKGKYIDAWGKMDGVGGTGRAIIDCMMNIALLMWAHKETKHIIYKDVAVAHAETTRKYFIRDDFSVAHSYDFNRATGEMSGENNGCGYENGSHWARGTAWAAYGFAILARYTDRDDYAELAANIFEKYKSEMKGGYVPVWDFRLPKDKPAAICGSATADWDETSPENRKFNVDTSAAAIMSCALLELYERTRNEDYRDFADNTLKTLCRPEFFNADPNIPGILKKQNGQTAYTLFGDFFFCEALQRLLYNTKTCW